MPEPEDNSARTGQIMQLSLFIMLLAFFIVLNAVSSYESNKMKSVLQTLDSTFSQGAREEWILPSAVEDPDESFREGHVLDQIEGLFEAEIPVFTVSRSDEEGVMYVRVREKYLDRVFAGAGSNSRSGFLLRLSNILQTGQDRRQYEMELLLGLGDNPAALAAKKSEKVTHAIEKTAFYAGQATRNGLPPKFMAMGMTRGREGFVDIRFRPYAAGEVIESNRGDYVPGGQE